MRGSSTVRHFPSEARHAALPGADSGLTRRRLIAGLVAGAAMPFLPTPARARGRIRVAIVGGGVAGLSALDRLTSAGIEATLYEARAQVGGRMRTIVGALGDGLAVDDGGQFVNSDHADIRALCKRLGLRLIDRHSAPGRSIMIDNAAPVPSAHLLRDLAPIAKRIGADADTVTADPQASAAFDRMSVAQYLDRIGAHGVARRLLESTIRTEYGVEPHQASAIEMLWNRPTVKDGRLEILGSSDERFVIAGGSQRLTDALAAPLRGQIRTGAIATRIGYAGDQLSIAFADGSSVTADRVILTVPASLYRSIAFDVRLPTLWQQFLAEIDLGRVEKLITGTNSRPWLKAIGPSGDLWSGPGFAEAWDATAGQPDLAAGAFTFFPGGDQIDNFATISMNELAARFADATEAAVPGFKAALNGKMRRTAWHADPFTRGCYVNYRPGQLTRFGGLLWGDHNANGGRVGRLLFAGEHMSVDFPGYMNGGAETGRRAAQAIIAEARRAQTA